MKTAVVEGIGLALQLAGVFAAGDCRRLRSAAALPRTQSKKII
jgi:hypothetical protein